METTSLLSSPSPSPPSPFPFRPLSNSPKLRNHRFTVSTKIFASHREAHEDKNYYSGRTVDEDMIVLRKRIHEMKMVERNYEPPAHWMNWEKRCYTTYDSIICEGMGIVQTQLMNCRPSLAVAIVALVLLSVPVSTGFVFFHLMEICKGILAAI